MQTLVFNTSTKSVKLYEGSIGKSEILFSFENVPTVKAVDHFYTVMQKEGMDAQLPVLRVPVSNTNMLIEK